MKKENCQAALQGSLHFVQMVHLYKDPDGETVLGPSTQETYPKAFSTATAADHHNEVTVLKQQISELENKLSEVKEFQYQACMYNILLF